MRSYVVVYARGLKSDGSVCDEGRLRCDLGLEMAKAIPNSFIVLGAGIPEYAELNYVSSLAEAMAIYFANNGWPREKILINPKGYETVGETIAAYEAIKKSGKGPITVVSSWYHVFRIWLIWIFRFGIFVKVRNVKHKVDISTLVKSVIAVFYSSCIAIIWNDRVASRVRKRIIKKYVIE